MFDEKKKERIKRRNIIYELLQISRQKPLTSQRGKKEDILWKCYEQLLDEGNESTITLEERG